jgi:hypothetical protein
MSSTNSVFSAHLLTPNVKVRRCARLYSRSPA